MNDNIQRIKDNLNIVDLIGSYVQLKRRGRNLFGVCPFHQEKSPSFSVNEDIQIFKCFGCGKSGDMFKFVEEYEHVDFKDALEILAKRAGVTLEKSHFESIKTDEKKIILELNEWATKIYEYTLEKLKIGEEGKAYANKRKITPELIKIFRIGYAPNSKNFLLKFLTEKKSYKVQDILKAGLIVEKNGKFEDKFKNRLMFPVLNNVGEVVAFSGRYIGTNTGEYAPPKYLNSPETIVFHKSKILYGLYQAKDEITHKDNVIISEGQVNIISSYRAERKNIVASMGTSLTLEHLKLLSRYTTNILFCFDKDNAGQTALMRSLILANQLDLNTKVVSLVKGSDPDDEIKADENQWHKDIDTAQDAFEYIYEQLSNKYGSNDNEQKLNIVKDVRAYLVSISNPVKKELYIKTLSSRLDINEDTIIKYLESKDSEIKIAEHINDINEAAKISGSHLEEFFIALLVQNWDELKETLVNVDARYFKNEKYANFLLKACFAVDMNIEELMETLEDDEKPIIQEALLKFMTIDDNADKPKTFMALYLRIKLFCIKAEVHDLRMKLRQKTDDPEEITNKLSILIKELNGISE